MRINSEQEYSDSWTHWKAPDWQSYYRNWSNWLDHKREDDGAEGLWRVHDSLYDLQAWSITHPGGSDWITLTKGTDITEAFECHHISNIAYIMLEKFYVRKATVPRNAPFSFKSDGFYNVLKGRVREELKNVPIGPSNYSTVLIDSMALVTLFSSILAVKFESWLLALLASIFLTLTTVCAHNFFHQRNSWRMYYFSLSTMSVRAWRVSHALSHHVFPNSKQDLEITQFEPFLQWLPNPKKTFITRFVSWIYSPIVYAAIYHAQYLPRLMIKPEGSIELIPLIIPTLMYAFNSQSLIHIFLWWNAILIGSSLIFGVIGLNAAHHHPELFHDGDKPRETSPDWGIYQMDAVRERVDVKGSTFLVLTLFGDHGLHHMFPTIDHAHLNRLYPVLEQTCKEFNIELKLGSLWQLFKGQFLQLAKITTNNFLK